MPNQTLATISTIVHATEDVEKIRHSISETLRADSAELSIQETAGHHGNPILLVGIRLVGEEAGAFVSKLAEALPDGAIEEIVDELDVLISRSGLHLRFNKQGLMGGRLELDGRGAIRVRIYTPVYRKGDAQNLYLAMLGRS